VDRGELGLLQTIQHIVGDSWNVEFIGEGQIDGGGEFLVESWTRLCPPSEVDAIHHPEQNP
jgi:hypothetical protein